MSGWHCMVRGAWLQTKSKYPVRRHRRLPARTFLDRAAMIGQDDVAACHRNVDQRVPPGMTSEKAERKLQRIYAPPGHAQQRQRRIAVAKDLEIAVLCQHVAISGVAGGHLSNIL